MTAEALTVTVPAEVTGPEAPATTTTATTGGEDTRKKYGDFDSVEELEQAYAALKGQEKEAPAPAAESETAAPEAEPETAARADADKALSDKGLDLASYEQEWSQHGALSEDSYKALEKAGLPKALVDRYIEGQTALMNTFVGEVQQIAGGADEYTTMTAWAKDNLSPQEVNAFNAIMNGGDREAIKLAVTGLTSRYREAEGHTPTLVGGKASAGAGARDAFESMAQVREAMRDPRYAKDPAYTKAVEEKMSRSKVFG